MLPGAFNPFVEGVTLQAKDDLGDVLGMLLEITLNTPSCVIREMTSDKMENLKFLG